MTPGMRNRVVAVVATAIAVAAIGWGIRWLDRPAPFAFDNPHQAGTPAHEAFAAYEAELQANPAFAALMADTTDPEAAMRRGAELTQRGVPRLSDAELVERLEMMLGLMRAGDAKQCALLAQGAPIDGDLAEFAGMMFAVLDRADADLARRWYAFSRNAMIAELEQRPFNPAPDGSDEKLGALLVEALAPEQLDALIAMSEQRLIGLGDDVRCGVGQEVLSLILAQPEPERGRYARIMATP